VSPRRRDEPVRLTRITTRGGDGGQTSLGNGARVSKLAPCIAATGSVDELGSLIGWVRVLLAGPPLDRIANELFDLGADLTVPYADGDGKLRIDRAALERLERDGSELNAALPDLRSFVLPGGSETAARLHVARAVCRRAERDVIAAAAAGPVNPLAAPYLNRLSDVLFMLARRENQDGEGEPLWLPGGPA
jgi:cob(I)alamin adenosyltransferase